MTTNGFNIHELNLNPGEHLVGVMRKHWFVLFVSIMPYLILFVLPFVVLAFIPSAGMSTVQIAVIIFFVTLWMLGLLMVIFTIWTTYYLDLWILTNQRIIDIEQFSLFNREIKTLMMKTVQDVQIDVLGVFQTLLGFGTLRVQTAGTGGTDAKIVGIPNPGAEKDRIIELVRLINLP